MFQLSRNPKVVFVLIVALPALKSIAGALGALDTNKSGADDKAAAAILAACAALETWVNEQSEDPIIIPKDAARRVRQALVKIEAADAAAAELES